MRQQSPHLILEGSTGLWKGLLRGQGAHSSRGDSNSTLGRPLKSTQPRGFQTHGIRFESRTAVFHRMPVSLLLAQPQRVQGQRCDLMSSFTKCGWGASMVSTGYVHLTDNERNRSGKSLLTVHRKASALPSSPGSLKFG